MAKLLQRISNLWGKVGVLMLFAFSFGLIISALLQDNPNPNTVVMPPALATSPITPWSHPQPLVGKHQTIKCTDCHAGATASDWGKAKETFPLGCGHTASGCHGD